MWIRLSRVHFKDFKAVVAGNNLLKMSAPGTPTPLPFKSSSEMLFSRREERGMPPKSMSEVWVSTTCASCSAPSPVIPLLLTLQVQKEGNKRVEMLSVAADDFWAKFWNVHLIETRVALTMSMSQILDMPSVV